MKQYEIIDKTLLDSLLEKKLSKQKICEEIFGFCNGTTTRKLQYSLNHYGYDRNSIKKNFYDSKRVYPVVEKTCPVCQKTFTTSVGQKGEKTVCSRACSNTHFRSGENNGNWSEDSYRTTCWAYHEKKCCVKDCGESRIVEVHHFDHNNTNNDPYNLVPLCPTHHKYWHSRYQPLIEADVVAYRKQWLEKNKDKNLTLNE
jgi:hypothetical protein